METNESGIFIIAGLTLINLLNLFSLLYFYLQIKFVISMYTTENLPWK